MRQEDGASCFICRAGVTGILVEMPTDFSEDSEDSEGLYFVPPPRGPGL